MGRVVIWTFDTAEKYNITNKTWESLPKMPGKRYGCAAGTVGNKFYVVGGYDENKNRFLSTQVIDASKQDWDSDEREIFPLS